YASDLIVVQRGFYIRNVAFPVNSG
ncbi:MAG: hypothetical protein ACI9TH_001127, partial [Kiritimatiellia bacterium]